MAKWLADKKPDVLFFCFNDHATTFFDHYPTFALGVSDEYAIADEGLGPRRIEVAIDCMYAQGMIARRLTVDKLFR